MQLAYAFKAHRTHAQARMDDLAMVGPQMGGDLPHCVEHLEWLVALRTVSHLDPPRDTRARLLAAAGEPPATYRCEETAAATETPGGQAPDPATR